MAFNNSYATKPVLNTVICGMGEREIECVFVLVYYAIHAHKSKGSI